MNYFISDTHFFHEKILGQNDFAPRLFNTVEEMNQTMLENWNRFVTDKDVVYHLGDIAIHQQYEKGSAEILAVLRQLRGKIHFIKGNHDSRAFFRYLEKYNPEMPDKEKKFTFSDVGTIVKFNHQQYYLTHYPMLLGQSDSIVNLHGHIHHYSVPIAADINVGVDAPERSFLEVKDPFGAPLSEKQIEEILQKKAEELRRLKQT